MSWSGIDSHGHWGEVSLPGCELWMSWYGDELTGVPLVKWIYVWLKPVQNVVNWSVTEHWLDVARHPQLGAKGDSGWGYPLLG